MSRPSCALLFCLGFGCAPREVVVVRPGPRPLPPPPVAVAPAPHPGWVMLGERTVNGSYDHDVIAVGDGRFRELMFVVEHRAIEMFDVRVTFGDGEVFDVPTRLVFPPDSRSRVIQLPGVRFVRKVDFAYGNVPGRGQARVELWAR